MLNQARSELSTLPNKLAREAGMDEIRDLSQEQKVFLAKELDIQRIGDPFQAWTNPPTPEQVQNENSSKDEDDLNKAADEGKK